MLDRKKNERVYSITGNGKLKEFFRDSAFVDFLHRDAGHETPVTGHVDN